MKSLIPVLLVFREKNNKEDLKKKKSFQLKYILIKTILIIGYRLINFTKKILIELSNNLNRIHKLKWKTSLGKL